MTERFKIVTIAPKSNAEAIRLAMGDAGAGKIGNYRKCSYSIDGIGRSLPVEGANPTIGEVGVYEEGEEERIETTCERTIAKKVINAIRKSHVYEEPEIDIYRLFPEEDL